MSLAPTGGHVRKAYINGRYGPLHYRYCVPADGGSGKNIALLLVASPNSGEVYSELLYELGKDRAVVAFDTPGYGESAAPPEPIANVADLAEVFADAIAVLSGKRIDVFGHHSGAALALALAARHPDRVGKVVVTGVPFKPDPTERSAAQARYPAFDQVATARGYLERNWGYWVDDRPADLSLDRAIRLFADSLSAGTRMNWLYRSVYGPGMEEWLKTIMAPIRFLQLDDFLSPNSLLAAAFVRDASIRDREDLHHASFVTRPADFAAELRDGWSD